MPAVLVGEPLPLLDPSSHLLARFCPPLRWKGMENFFSGKKTRGLGFFPGTTTRTFG